MQNYWLTYDDSIVTWFLTIPRLTIADDLERLLEIANRILAIGEQHDIYKLIKHEGYFEGEKSPAQYYIDYTREITKKTGYDELFKLDPTILIGEKVIPTTRLCYFKHGQIVQQEVVDIGLIVEELDKDAGVMEYEDIEFENEMEAWLYYERLAKAPKPTLHYHVTPVKLFGSQESNNAYTVTVMLYTDIWLPWVANFQKRDRTKPKEELYDNRPLANCHTPRLNGFIADLRQLAHEFAGEWKLSEVLYPQYKSMVTEMGIKLDV